MNECPQVNELARLMANPGDVIAWELLEQHLASCIDCRQRLDALADADSLIKRGNGTWRSQSSSSLALQQVIEKLQASPDKGAAAASPLTANAILAFLQPTEAPGFLGDLEFTRFAASLGREGWGLCWRRRTLF